MKPSRLMKSCRTLKRFKGSLVVWFLISLIGQSAWSETKSCDAFLNPLSSPVDSKNSLTARGKSYLTLLEMYLKSRENQNTDSDFLLTSLLKHPSPYNPITNPTNSYDVQLQAGFTQILSGLKPEEWMAIRGSISSLAKKDSDEKLIKGEKRKQTGFVVTPGEISILEEPQKKALLSAGFFAKNGDFYFAYYSYKGIEVYQKKKDEIEFKQVFKRTPLNEVQSVGKLKLIQGYGDQIHLVLVGSKTESFFYELHLYTFDFAQQRIEHRGGAETSISFWRLAHFGFDTYTSEDGLIYIAMKGQSFIDNDNGKSTDKSTTTAFVFDEKNGDIKTLIDKKSGVSSPKVYFHKSRDQLLLVTGVLEPEVFNLSSPVEESSPEPKTSRWGWLQSWFKEKVTSNTATKSDPHSFSSTISDENGHFLFQTADSDFKIFELQKNNEWSPVESESISALVTQLDLKDVSKDKTLRNLSGIHLVKGDNNNIYFFLNTRTKTDAWVWKVGVFNTKEKTVRLTKAEVGYASMMAHLELRAQVASPQQILIVLNTRLYQTEDYKTEVFKMDIESENVIHQTTIETKYDSNRLPNDLQLLIGPDKLDVYMLGPYHSLRSLYKSL